MVTDDLSDHYPTLVILHNIEQCKKGKVKIHKRKIDSDEIDSIKTDLDRMDWTCLNSMGVNEAFEFFHTTLLGTIDVHCPKREYSINHDKII